MHGILLSLETSTHFKIPLHHKMLKVFKTLIIVFFPQEITSIPVQLKIQYGQDIYASINRATDLCQAKPTNLSSQAHSTPSEISHWSQALKQILHCQLHPWIQIASDIEALRLILDSSQGTGNLVEHRNQSRLFMNIEYASDGNNIVSTFHAMHGLIPTVNV